MEDKVEKDGAWGEGMMEQTRLVLSLNHTSGLNGEKGKAFLIACDWILISIGQDFPVPEK